MALILEIKVNPSSGMSKIILDKTGRLVVYVKSPPEDGKANRELIKLFAQALLINQQDITIISGLTARKKKLKIVQPLTLESVMHKLGLDIQKKVF